MTEFSPALDDLAEGAARLVEHPWVSRVDIVAADTDTDADTLRIVVAANALLTTRGKDETRVGGLVREHLGHWAEVYDWTYASESAAEPEMDLAGWRATDTGEPLPADHMAQWVDRTVELVLEQGPRNILELGCGTGLLMRRLLPEVDSYIGVDVAVEVVERLRGLDLRGARFVWAAAHEVRGAAVRDAIAHAGERPDCILLNSVTQCFPSVDYLAAVVLDALDLVAPGGTVIVGDIRHSGQLLDFARWAESARLDDPDPATLAARAERRANADTEMSIDPFTLASIAAASRRGVSIQLRAKTMTLDSELTRYRFDAVLHVESPVSEEPAPAATVSWAALGTDDEARLGALRGRVLKGAVLVAGIPSSVTASALRDEVLGTGAAILIDPATPSILQVAAPPRAGAIALADFDAVTAPHEPIGAFARTRVLEVARKMLHQSGIKRPARMEVALPSGRGLAALESGRRTAAVDRGGRLAVSGTGEPVFDAALARVPGAVERLDQFALQVMSDYLVAAGVAPGVPCSVGGLIDALRVAPRHEWIVRRWLQVLCEEGRARLADGQFVLSSADADRAGPLDRRALARACRALGYPAAMAEFYASAVAALELLVRDELAPQSLMFPDGDITTSLGKDENNISNRYLHASAAEVVAEAARTRPGPLRVLELGGGAGGGTRAALSACRGEDVDYVFSDISRFFTGSAAERFGEHGDFRTALVDIDRSLLGQGLPAGGFDVVLAANVLHCAHDAGFSIGSIAEVLAPAGLVVVVEAVRESYLALLTMQFLLSPAEGAPHPGAGDGRALAGGVFLSAAGLRGALAAAGLRTTMELPGAGTPLDAPAQRLFVAQAL